MQICMICVEWQVNVSQVFELVVGVDFSGRYVLLVDDVVIIGVMFEVCGVEFLWYFNFELSMVVIVIVD